MVKELVLKANGLRPREFKSRLCRFWILYAKSICCKKKCCCYIFWYFWTIVFVVKFLAYIISINLCHFVFHTFFFLCRFFSLCVLNTLSYFLIYYKKWYKKIKNQFFFNPLFEQHIGETVDFVFSLLICFFMCFYI